MTRITIELADEEVEAVRISWKPSDDGLHPGFSVARKVYEALPPAKIEPKAGGTCRALNPSGGQRARTILTLDGDYVWVQGQGNDSDCAYRYKRAHFEEQFEVLS